jgi:UDP-2,4-diacetamido-2,4,6-trideoxy-beta-L-altropyranose hydrolase
VNRPIVFRPDAGPSVGLGHLRRCVSLALALRNDGADCVFDIVEGREIAAAAGFEVGRVDDPTAIVIDSYRATESDFSGKVIAIDDLADRVLAVDLVINPAIGAERLDYRAAKSTALGIEYALLRPEFADKPNRVYAPVARHVLITLGGADLYGLTPRFVESVAASFEELSVVIGPFFGRQLATEEVARKYPSVTLYHNPSEMRALLLRADLALSGGGQSVFELAATATPAVVIEVAPNQRRHVQGFADAGAIDLVGSAEDADIVDKATAALRSLANDRERRRRLGMTGRKLVDGLGAVRAARRVLEQIESAT